MNRSRKREIQENLVQMAIEVLENEVDPKFNRKRALRRMSLHKQVNNKYHKMFMRVIDYLYELRGNNKNPINEVLVDYYTCVYGRFAGFGRTPSLMNFSPSSSNKVYFEEFIYDFTASHKEEYWVKKLTKAPEVIRVPIIPEENDSMPTFTEV